MRKLPLVPPAVEAATASVVSIGGGRGFIVESGQRGRFIITVAHCLPALPPAMSFSNLEERTYQNIAGPLGSSIMNI